MAEGGDGEEPGKAGQVAHECLRLDLLLEIGLHVRDQPIVSFRRLRGGHERQGAVPQRRGEVEVLAHLLREEWVHLADEGPAREQVHAAVPKLARARAREDEPESPRLDQAVYLVQELREALDLVDQHPSASLEGCKPLPEERGIGDEPLVERLVEEIHRRPREAEAGHPRALPRAPGSEEEERGFRGGENARIEVEQHAARIRRKMVACHPALRA